MKKQILLLSIFSMALLSYSFLVKPTTTTLKGSWKLDNATMICSDSYFSIAYFDVAQKKFEGTMGGTYKIDGENIKVNIEFSHPAKELVGQGVETTLEVKDGKFHFNNPDGMQIWSKVGEAGNSPLSALWQITGRENKEGAMSEIKKAARKTIKLLTDDRFQWAAINTETGEFFGTGGGTYTLKDGKYTENIEFFSRDSSRVGASLSFDAKVEGANWQHMGESSKGDKVNEVWTKQD